MNITIIPSNQGMLMHAPGAMPVGCKYQPTSASPAPLPPAVADPCECLPFETCAKCRARDGKAAPVKPKTRGEEAAENCIFRCGSVVGPDGASMDGVSIFNWGFATYSFAGLDEAISGTRKRFANLINAERADAFAQGRDKGLELAATKGLDVSDDLREVLAADIRKLKTTTKGTT